MRSIPNFSELERYHQFHHIKVATDIRAALAFRSLLSHDRVALALLQVRTAGLVSGATMIWPPESE